MSKTICIQYCRNSRMNSVKMQKRNWIERRMCKTNTVSFKHVHFHSPNTDTKNWCNKVQIKFSKKKFVRAMVLALYHSNRVALNTCVYFSFLFFVFLAVIANTASQKIRVICLIFTWIFHYWQTIVSKIISKIYFQSSYWMNANNTARQLCNFNQFWFHFGIKIDVYQ